MTLKILLVDDSHTFLTAVQMFLGTLPNVQVVGLAHDGPQALIEAKRLQPDLVLLDIVMPGMSGFEVAHVLRSRSLPPRIVFLSLHDGNDYRARAHAQGAVGFVSKNDFCVELFSLLETLVSQVDAVPGARA